MKCPKCDYLGFETGDRCKNCGYDFSLLTSRSDAAPEWDLPLREPVTADSPLRITLDPPSLSRRFGPPSLPGSFGEAGAGPTPSSPMAGEASDTRHVPVAPIARPTLVEPRPVERPQGVPADRVAKAMVDSLPLFTRDDDAPLIRLPSAPRAPLAVRRTPDVRRPRMVHKAARRTPAPAPTPNLDPLLMFADEPAQESTALTTPGRPGRGSAAETSGSARRAIAALIDHSLLLAVDAVVVYFTLRLAGITLNDWQSVPLVPMAMFLLLVKVAYFCVFTLVGGQTIGKMAARIRVVADDDAPLDPARAIRRTCAGLVSAVTLGVGFLPAFIASDHRALHDRLARTRVIAI